MMMVVYLNDVLYQGNHSNENPVFDDQIFVGKEILPLNHFSRALAYSHIY